MSRLRWWLARRIAPAPIMRDPFPDEDGVFVYGVQGGFVWTVRANRFRMKSTTKLAPLEYEPGRPFDYRSSEPFTRFVGTVGRPIGSAEAQ